MVYNFTFTTKKMKTLSNPGLYVLAVAAIFAASCKGKTDSSAASGSAAGAAPASVQAAKGGSVIDSLQITDPAEVKLCKLYDDAVTEYMNRVQLALTDTSKVKSTDYTDIDKKFKDESEKLQPEIKNLQVTLTSNPVELMKFEKFSIYEGQRMAAIATKFGLLMKIPK
jgi:hypothetical protein